MLQECALAIREVKNSSNGEDGGSFYRDYVDKASVSVGRLSSNENNAPQALL